MVRETDKQLTKYVECQIECYTERNQATRGVESVRVKGASLHMVVYEELLGTVTNE